ncbi:MAG: DUF2892 domain-containing protein [Thermodesulfobacteriota bacterium]
MRVEKYLRLIAGLFVIISLLLSRLHSEYWLLFTAFVGINLFQSGFTNWCPMKSLLEGVFGREACVKDKPGAPC